MGLVYLPTFTVKKTTKCRYIDIPFMDDMDRYVHSDWISLRRSNVQMLVPLFLVGHVPTMFCGSRGQKLEADSLSAKKTWTQ